MRLPELNSEVERILFAHQKTPARQLVRALQCGAEEWGYSGAVDLSEVGTGKSFMDAAAALSTGRRPIVMCPVVGIGGWEKTFALFGEQPAFIGSYEAVRGGWRESVAKKTGSFFKWAEPENRVLILDEAQKVKGAESQTTWLVGGAIIQRIPIIAASATLADSPLQMRISGFVTGLHTGGKDWRRFVIESGGWFDEKEERWKWQPTRQNIEKLARLNELLVPARGCRLLKKDCGEQAGTTIKTLPLNVPEMDELNTAWEEVEEKVKSMERARDDKGKPRFPREVITGVRRAGRMKIWKQSELALVPAVAKRVRECLNEGKSVVVFFNFTEARLAMGRIFGTHAGFFGGQSKIQRKKIEADFQANRERLLLCNIGAGGASVNLQDLSGESQRETFIFPPDDPVKLGQAPGRVDRTGGKTHSLQWIPYFPGGLIESILKSTMRKGRTMAIINDGTGQESLIK